MLFNSYEFLFFFLPISYFGYWFLQHRFANSFSLVFLLVMSLVFYGWWKPIFLLLLVFSIVSNFYLARLLLALKAKEKNLKQALIAGIVLNLGLLAYFKYANFFLENYRLLSGSTYLEVNVVLPLAISFFTFQQIAFLVDVYNGKAKQLNLLKYSVFVSFFPQLIAGPIVHHSEIFPQLDNSAKRSVDSKESILGLAQFIVGLSKKVLIADALGHIVDPVFADESIAFNSLDYGVAVAAFSLQIYFDFSAYSDMAIGIGRMFGITLPVNFNSPYKATNVIDFWRRWHITLSRFLKNYLYIPLGGNRSGSRRRYVNLLITMLLGGLWHGAHWNFVIWGGLHGVYLMINHAFKTTLLSKKLTLTSGLSKAFVTGISIMITWLSIAMAWVFFRAESTSHAVSILSTLVGFEDSKFSSAFLFVLAGVPLNGWFGAITSYWILIALFVIGFSVLRLPNCQEIFYQHGQVKNEKKNGLALLFWSLVLTLLLVLSIMNLGGLDEFIYFQF